MIGFQDLETLHREVEPSRPRTERRLGKSD